MIEAPTPRFARASPIGVGAAIAVITGAAALAARLYGGGFVNFDAMWSLVWGRQLAGLQAPTYDAPGAPTPHPLATLVGVVLSPLGSAAEPVLHALAFVALGTLVYATGLLGTRMFGLLAGVVAAVLLFSRSTIELYGSLAYLDIPFTALLMSAFAVEAGGRHRGRPVLILLALAGLLRPEAWLLSLLYLCVLRPGRRLQRIQLGALALAAPCAWALWDLVVTGDPTFSFTRTRAQASSNHAFRGWDGLIQHGPRMLGEQLRPAVLGVALVGYVLCLVKGPRVLIVWTLAVATAICIPVLAGTGLDARYLLPVIALACVAAGAAVSGWARASGPARWLTVAVAGASVVALVVTAPAQVQRLRYERAMMAAMGRSRDDARRVLTSTSICLPLAIPTPFMVPLVLIWTRAMPRVDAAPAGPRRARSFLSGTVLAQVGSVIVGRRSEPPPAARVVRRLGGWELSTDCA